MTNLQTSSSRRTPSPWVSASLLANRSTRISSIQIWRDTIFWLEMRADIQGKAVIVAKKGDAAPYDVTDPASNVRTTVNEYGGGAYCVDPNGHVIFSSGSDDRVYTQNGDDLTCLGGTDGCRYADFTCARDMMGNALSEHFGVICVREDHRKGEEVETTLVFLSKNFECIIARGHDFYAAPRLSPDGKQIAYICWDHPNMPWDQTQLTVASLMWSSAGPSLINQVLLEGADTPCSVMDPLWKDDATLYAVTDSDAKWRPVMFKFGTQWIRHQIPDPGFEIGMPAWVFAQRAIALMPNGSLLAHGHDNSIPRVACLNGPCWVDVQVGLASEVPLPISGEFVWIEAPSDGPPALRVGIDKVHSRVIRQSFDFPDEIGPEDCARPRPITFPTRDGAQAHALYYPPVGSVTISAPGEPPPLVVMAHGGPTAAASPSFSFKVQWWVTRGFGVLDVNYRGSTGWGRHFRQALYGEWGARDVADCIDAVAYVCAQGWADRARCVIRGSSAGGLTVLLALAHSKLFCAGTSLYGVTDLMTLAAETHKFESRYLDRLVGPLPECADLYRARSPLHHAAKINAPVLFLHGDADRVVPLSQAEEMHRLLQARSTTTSLVVYPGEAHGFRKPETLQDAFTREYLFYLEVFGVDGVSSRETT